MTTFRRQIPRTQALAGERRGGAVPGADWRDNPLPVAITRREGDAGSTPRVGTAPGGQAIRIRPARQERG